MTVISKQSKQSKRARKREREVVVQACRQILASLSEHLRNPMCLLDRKSRLLWSNAAWGRAREEINSPTLSDWVEVDLQPGKTEVLFGHQQVSGYLEIYRLGKGKQRLWLVIFTAHSDVPENLKAAVSQGQPIGAEMLEAQQMQTLGVLTARFAHDFSNLLTAILGNADFIAEAITLGSADGRAARQAVDSVIAASELSADMCRQLLAYASQPDEDPGDAEVLELSALMDDMHRMIQVVTSQRADVIMQLQTAGVEVQGNATRIRQLVLNLIVNATEAMEQPGTIIVSTGYMWADADILAGSVFEDAAPGRYGYLEIADNGRGIDPDFLDAIFQPFYSTKTQGRGLGLAAVYNIVQAHQGTMLVGSSASGTRFRILLHPAEVQLT